MHPSEHDYTGFGFCRLTRQRQTVADDVGNAVKDFWCLIVVREDDGITVPLEVEDGGDITGKTRPFDRRDDAPHALIELGGGRGQVSRLRRINHGVPLMLKLSIYSCEK